MAKKRRRVAASRPASAARSVEPKSYIPELGQYYPWASDVAYLLLRVTAGLMLLPHGWPKMMAASGAAGIGGLSANLARYGVPTPEVSAVLLIALETLGAILIAIGLWTRPVALLLVFEFLVIIFIAHWPRGYMGAGGIEFPLLWGICFLVILLRGGGPYSVDRNIGKEV